MRRLAIVGGGISGLAAAWAARWQQEAAGGQPEGLEIVVLEAGAEVGGKARTFVRDGYRVEEGPQGYLDTEPVLDRLVAAAGLEEEKVEAAAAAARRYVLRKGRVREVAMNPFRLATNGIFSPLGFGRLLLEPFVPRRRVPQPPGSAGNGPEAGAGDVYRSAQDESVYQFAARRLGKQAAERLVAPMVLGIFAGNARSLSLASAFPRLHEMETNHGSLLRGMIAGRKEGGARRGGLVSQRRGLQELLRALAARGDFEVRCGSAVSALSRTATGFEVAVENAEPLRADAVILATEPWSAAALLGATAPEIAHELEGIEGPPVAVVGLGYARQDVTGIPPGFGVLVPRGERIAMLGCLWESNVFPDRSPQDTLLVRAMYGGAVDPESGQLTPDELVDTARRELERLFGVKAKPRLEHVARWERAIPQYELGHGIRVRRIERALAELPGLYLAGNGLYGVAFAKSAAIGAGAGEAAVTHLQGPGLGTRTSA